MGGFSDYTEDAVLDHIVGKTSFTMPTCYVGLSIADPLDDASGLDEPSGNGYVRKSTAGADWNASANGSGSNANDISFAEASGAWGELTHFGLFDAESGGNMLAHGTLAASKIIGDGDTAKFAGGTPGELTYTLN